MLPNLFEDKLFILASAQFLFPEMVFISPLCAITLYGCAKCHFGEVFVENLIWNITLAVRCEVSDRSL